MYRSVFLKVSVVLFAVVIAVSFVCLTGTESYAAGEVEINEYSFPDENFRNWISSNIPHSQSDRITPAEIANVTSIDVPSKNISNLKGIEYFTALNALYCYSNQLTSLDVSKNTALETLYCDSNQLTDLDVSGCTALTYLSCYSNQLTSLDVSNNTALTYLSCESNQLTDLDVSGCTALKDLYCYSNQLTSLDVSKNTALTRLYCYSNQLTSLDVSKNTALTYLSCGSNQLTSLDVCKNTTFNVLKYDNNPLEVFNGEVLINEYSFPDDNFRSWVSSNITHAQSDRITPAEIAAVTSIDVHSQNISNLKGIEYFTVLKTLLCYSNQLTSLDVSKNTALTRLLCHFNQLTSLDVSKNTALTKLYCSSNQLTDLDVSNNPALVNLYCDSNQLTDLDVSGCTALETLSCHSNQLDSLDVSKNTTLEYLLCYSNQLTDLDVSGCTALDTLSCSSNQLTDLDVSGCTALETLSCFSNQLTDLDVSNNTALKGLYCYSNQLTDLDVSKNTALKDLHCQSNQLTSLDVSENKALTDLDCTYEKLDKVYVHSDTAYPITKHDNTKVIVISKDDWTYNIKCSGNATDGFRLAAEYVCTKDEDYKITLPVQFTIDSVSPANCTDPEKTTFTVTLSAQDAYDGKAIDTKETFDTAPALGHDWQEATCTEPKTCKRCQATEGDAKGHNWGSWNVTTPAKVNVKGVETRKCLDCGKEETRDIEAVKPTATPTATATPKPTATTKPTATPTVKPTAAPTATTKPTATPTVKPTATATPKPTATSTPVPTSKPTATPAVSIKLDKKTASVVCGKSMTLKATVKNTTDKVIWKSSDNKVAKVDANGKVTTKKAGTVTITATAAGKSASCKITVLYKDVSDKSLFWYKPVNYLTAKGIVKGYDNGTVFEPANHKKCTRAQMVTFIWRLAGQPEPKATTCKFKDVKATDYYYKACIWGNEKHIVEGYKDNTFGPKIVCARRHAVTFLWRLAGKPEPKTDKCRFTDVNSGEYYYKPVLWATETGILAGYPDNTFRPNGDCLRRQMVTFLYKYDKFVNNK